MNIGRSLSVLMLGLATWPILIGHAGGAQKPEPVQKKVSPIRLKGMKDALVDLEKGIIKQKDYGDRPDSLSWGAYVELTKKECGVVWEIVQRNKIASEDMDGYNDVMRAEIEHRFERGILEKLEKKAAERKK